MRRLFREKMLGSARSRTYDIPLDRGAGSGFLILLVLLMTFLAMLALSSSFVLGAMTSRWSSGLENKVTIEIPATNSEGETRSLAEIQAVAGRMKSLLGNHPAIAQTEILKSEDVLALVAPWLGEDLSLAEIPVPGLISVELIDADAAVIKGLSERISAIDAASRLDAHEAWLGDLLRFTRSLHFAAFLLALIISITTVTAVAGAVRARMAMHKAEVELLHLMGASDEYITRQFQRHSLLLALKGGIAGTLAAFAGLMIVDWIGGEMDVVLLPDFRLHVLQIAALMAMPLAIALIATLTARFTVMRALVRMP
ncbi:MAG: FtsX-like permease family protein [Alphaproteobacteria bacterium]|nr:FtsX-like permease family protein [Alphaproteobacteria bacterium]